MCYHGLSQMKRTREEIMDTEKKDAAKGVLAIISDIVCAIGEVIATALLD